MSVTLSGRLRLAGRLALTTALGTLALGYGRRAYAGNCNPVSVAFLCAGPSDGATDVSQIISASPLGVSTAPGFGLDTSRLGGVDALTLTGVGGLTFDGAATGLSLTSNGNGVMAANTGGGLLSIDTRGGSVTSDDLSAYPPSSYYALKASNGGGGAGMTLRIGDVTSRGHGVGGSNDGGGSLVIDSTEGVIDAARVGITAVNAGTDLLITTADVRSILARAIVAQNNGTGGTVIDTRGGAIQGRGATISATTSGNGLDIRSADVVGGVFARNDGTGLTSIDTSLGNVEASGISGVYVLAGATAGAVDVRTANVAGARGIRIINRGTGASSVDTTAGLAFGDNAGIRVDQQSASGAGVTVRAADVIGNGRGIYVTSLSAAPTLVDSTAGTVRANLYSGISVDAGSITMRSAQVEGSSGLTILNRTGAALIDTTAGTVTGTAGDGINVYSSGTDVSVTTGDVTGAARGVYVKNQGTGVLTIDTTAGSVAGSIDAWNYGDALTIAAGSSGDINAHNTGTGDLTVVASSGPLDPADLRSAVRATNRGRNTSVILTGSFASAYAKHLGTGNAMVDTSAASMISGPAISAVYLYATAGDAQVITSNVEFNGLFPSAVAVSLNNRGTGHSRIDTRGGTVSASGATPDVKWSRGVEGSSRNGLAIYTGAVTSNYTAVTAVNAESGELVVDTTGGAINSLTAIGIEASATGSSGALRIAARDISAGAVAISATQEGGGGLSIVDHGGRVSGTIVADNMGAGAALIDTRGATLVSSASAIIAYNSGSSLSISTSDVDAQANAIVAKNFGPGDLVVDTSAGAVRSAGNVGIAAVSSGNGLTIKSGDVTGSNIGITASNTGRGDLTIDGNGTLAGAYAALWAESSGAGLNVDLAGKADGRLFFLHGGAGNSRVDLSRAAVTSDRNGVELVSASGDVDLKTGTVLSTYEDTLSAAVAISQRGDGAVIADARAGALESLNGLGLYALSEGTGQVSVMTANVSAALQGVIVLNRGGGSIAIDSTAGTVRSASSSAIYALNEAAGSDVTISAATAQGGGPAGILAMNRGTGSTTIAVAASGLIEGSTAAIDLSHAGTGSFSLANAGTLRNASGNPAALAVRAVAVDGGSGFSLRNTGTITGTVQLTGKNDSFVNDGTWNMAGGTSDFGAGIDVFDNRSNLTFVAAADPARAETTTLTNLESFCNSGTIRMADGGAGDVFTTSGDFDGTGGTINLDMMADGSAADLFRILGSVTGGPTMVEINYLGTGGVLGVAGAPFIAVAGETKEGDFRIANPVWDGLVYKMVLGPDNRWGATPAFSLADTFAGLARDAQVAGRLLDGQQAGLVNAMALDCTGFGASGACLSLGGRGTTLSHDTGASDALVLTGAVRPTGSRWRIGAFLDQRVAGDLPNGFSFESMGPTLGGFAGYGAADRLGPRLRLSGAWSTAQLGIERPALLGLIEGGEAEARFSGWGLGGEVGYGLSLGDAATLTPFAGLRRVASTRSAYVEQGGDAAYPLSANAMGLAQTTLSSGLTFQAGLSSAVSFTAGLGVETDIAYEIESFNGSFEDVGRFALAPDRPWLRTRLFGGAGLDYEIEDGIGLSLAASARQLPLEGVTDVTATAAMRAAF